MGPQDLLELVEPLLQLAPITGAQARLLALLVLAVCAIATAPPTGGLAAITLDLRMTSSAWPYQVDVILRHGAVLERICDTSTQGSEGCGYLTFLCLQSSHLGVILSSAIFLFLGLGSGDGEVGSGFTSMLSPTESTVGDWEHGDMGRSAE